jgi:hypothetical protein
MCASTLNEYWAMIIQREGSRGGKAARARRDPCHVLTRNLEPEACHMVTVLARHQILRTVTSPVPANAVGSSTVSW